MKTGKALVEEAWQKTSAANDDGEEVNLATIRQISKSQFLLPKSVQPEIEMVLNNAQSKIGGAQDVVQMAQAKVKKSKNEVDTRAMIQILLKKK